ncbi:hypothetical protein KY290_024866 [Solanum tuberosum]|uniref:Gag-pol polyprotein n=1 Tax=Solanum tuberosum TaxID=4113 RepID=A0ABQ7UTX0_SOLTU|nr:hypothetical protein KY284_023724 [Solanum tuberosum]KAH0754596.1 hypothetical protein KY290_024866 [Solanum tuberosum]
MSHFNHMSYILNHNKLECPNYVDWKRNLDIVLTFEGFKYVFVEECSIKPTDATDEEIKVYEKWVKADEMAREKKCVAKQTTMKAILTSKMIEGSPVNDHVLNMMSYLNDLEILGTTIDKESQKTPPSVAYIVGKPVASSSKSAKAQKKKKKSCKVVAPGGGTGGVVSLRSSATTPSSVVTTRGNCPDYQAKMKNKGNAAAK